MKNQLVERSCTALFWGLFFSLWFGLSACSGVVQGKLYFDENGNGMMDGSEIGAPYVKITVMKNGKLEKEGFTKPDGSFSFRKDKGVYYLKADLSSVDYDRARLAGSAYAANEVAGSGAAKAQTKELWDEDDSAADDDATSDATSDDTAQDDSSSDSSSTETSEPGEGYEGYVQNVGHRIVSNSNFSSLTGIMIPIGFDREGSLSSVPVPTSQNCYIGEACAVSISSFQGCSCEVRLPADISVDSTSKWRNNTSLGTATYPAQSQGTFGAMKASVDSTSLSPAVAVVALPLIVSDTAEPRDVKIEPVISCPDGEISHSPVTLKLMRDLSPVTIVSYSGSLVSKGFGVFTIEVKQEGKSRLDGYVSLTFGGDKLPAIMNPYECKNIGGGVLCEVAKLASGTKKAFTVRVQMPKTDDGDVEITASAVFKSRHLESEEGVPALADVTLNIPGL